MDIRKLKSIMMYIFVAVLLITLGFSFNLGNYTLPVARIAGLAILLWASSELRSNYKSANLLFFISLILLVVCVASSFSSLLTDYNFSDTLSGVTTVSVSSDGLTSENVEKIRTIQSTIAASSGAIIAVLSISSAVALIIEAILLYGVTKLELEILQSKLVDLKKNPTKRDAITMMILYVILYAAVFAMQFVVINGFKTLDTTSADTIIAGVKGMLPGVIVAIGVMAVSGIALLVFGIKYLIDLYKNPSYAEKSELQKQNTPSNIDKENVINAEVKDVDDNQDHYNTF